MTLRCDEIIITIVFLHYLIMMDNYSITVGGSTVSLLVSFLKPQEFFIFMQKRDLVADFIEAMNFGAAKSTDTRAVGSRTQAQTHF